MVKHLFRVVVAISFALVLSNCSEDTENPVAGKALDQIEAEGSATVYLPQIPEGFLSKKARSRVGRLVLAVSGPGMDSMTYSWSVDSIPVKPFRIKGIPAGRRRFSGFLYHSDGTISHEGNAYATIESGKTAVVYLSLKRAAGSAVVYVEIEGLTPPNPDLSGCWDVRTWGPIGDTPWKFRLNQRDSLIYGAAYRSDRYKTKLHGTVVYLGKSPTIYLEKPDDSLVFKGRFDKDRGIFGYIFPLGVDSALVGKWRAMRTDTCWFPKPPVPPQDTCHWVSLGFAPDCKDTAEWVSLALAYCDSAGSALNAVRYEKPCKIEGHFQSAIILVCPRDTVVPPPPPADSCRWIEEGGPTSCKDTATWRSYAENNCREMGGYLSGIKFRKPCPGGQYRYMIYQVCFDSVAPPPPPPSDPCEDSISVITPKAGEHFTVGDTMMVTYCADSALVNAVVLSLSLDAGLNWHQIGTRPFAPGKQTVPFAISDSLLEVYGGEIAKDCYVRANDYDEVYVQDISGPFSIGYSPLIDK